MTRRIGMKQCGCKACHCDKRISARSTREPVCDYCYNGIHRKGEL